MSDKIRKYDVIIVGGGASGLTAAISCKRKDTKLKVCILESQVKLGKKLLATGNGRCNLTNENITSNSYYGSFNPEFVLEKVSPGKLKNYFNTMGLLCRTENNGLVYPYCKQASAVLECLRFEIARLNIDIICNCSVNGVRRTNSDFIVKTTTGILICKKIIICCGGKASPECGGTGSGLDVLKNMGHTIKSISPALCPIETTSKVIKGLKGVRAAATVSLYDDDKLIKTEQGEVQFTEKALSGICVFNLSSVVNTLTTPRIKVAFFPQCDPKEISCELYRRIAVFSNNTLEEFLVGVLNKKIAIAILNDCNIGPLSRKCNTLNTNEIEKISHTVNNWYFNCKYTTDFSKAQVMTGGVAGNEIDSKTMESKKIKDLYICGEIIDINGDCGGYNLHFAFASGIVAGENI